MATIQSVALLDAETTEAVAAQLSRPPLEALRRARDTLVCHWQRDEMTGRLLCHWKLDPASGRLSSAYLAQFETPAG